MIMLTVRFFLQCFLLYGSSVLADNECHPDTSSWTPWFNTQDPLKTNGNDIEDISIIRKSHPEAVRCDTVSNVEYALIGKANNETMFYQTLINNNGVFCMGSPTSRCPDYRVRFCCPLEQKYPGQQCGQTFRQPLLNPHLRIVNGFEAIPHSLPWVVSLQYKGVHDCGGVIIDQWHILTAAHCLDYTNDLVNYYARVGAHNRFISGQLMPIAELTIYPTYDEQRSADDIGVIRLASPIQFSADMQPICLFDDVRPITNGFLTFDNVSSLYRSPNQASIPPSTWPVGETPPIRCGIAPVPCFSKRACASSPTVRCTSPTSLELRSVPCTMGPSIRIMGAFSELFLLHDHRVIFCLVS